MEFKSKKDSSMHEKFWLLKIEIARLCSGVYMIFWWKTEFELNWTKQIICDKTDLPSQFWALVENGSFYNLSTYKIMKKSKGAFVYCSKLYSWLKWMEKPETQTETLNGI